MMVTTTVSPHVSDISDVSPLKFGKSFAWLHAGFCDTGVIICPGIGRDARLAYGAMRLLAVELSRRGYPTLRFDYPGTGDALDLDDDEPCAAWTQSIHAAAARMREAGVTQLIFCGVRLGGLLATAVAAQRDDVAGLILLDPIPSGALFLREIAVEQSLLSDATGHDHDVIESDGNIIGPASNQPFRALNLMKLGARPAPRILILASAKRPANEKLAAYFETLGAEVQRTDFAPIAENDDDGMVNPQPPIEPIVDWLGAATISQSRPTAPMPATIELQGRLGSYAENPLRFGPGQRLFGMLCRPHHDAMPGFVLVIGNGGAVAHQGYARFAVLFARRLAEAGYATLRMDYAGIGESPAAEPTHLFATDRSNDISVAIDTLEQLGFSRFGVGGLCSGSYHSWRAALADHRIETLAMLSPSAFHWPKNQDFGKYLRENTRSSSFYFETMRRRNGWQRLVRGELNWRRATRTFGNHMLRRALAAGNRVAASLGWNSKGVSPRHAMARLSARGVRVFVMIGTVDAGLDLLEAHFGRGGRWLTNLPGATLCLMPDVDHSLTRIAMHEKVAAAAIGFLRAGHVAPTHALLVASPTLAPEPVPANDVIETKRVGMPIELSVQAKA